MLFAVKRMRYGKERLSMVVVEEYCNRLHRMKGLVLEASNNPQHSLKALVIEAFENHRHSFGFELNSTK